MTHRGFWFILARMRRVWHRRGDGGVCWRILQPRDRVYRRLNGGRPDAFVRQHGAPHGFRVDPERLGFVAAVSLLDRTHHRQSQGRDHVEGDLTLDFAAPISGSDAFQAESRCLDQLAGGGWQTESATQQNANVLQGIAARIRPSLPSSDGTSTSAAQDLATARLGLGDLPILTRLRAELPASALTRDLLLRASAEGVKARDYTFLATTNTVTPPACPPLNCLSGWGRRETDGTIRYPFGQSVAPSTTFSGRYTAGSLPTHIAQVTTVEPSVLPRTYEQCRNSDGTLIPRTGGGGCSVRSAPANPRGLMPLLAGIAVCVSLRRKRQSPAK